MIFRRTRSAAPPEATAKPEVVAPAGEFGPSVCGRIIDLMPIPAAIVRFDGETLRFEAVNRPFRRAGLGSVDAESSLVRLLGGRIVAFLRSAETHQEFAWQVGDTIDAQHFRVMLARRVEARDSLRCLVSLVDQTAEQRTETSLRREMLSDSLTGLPNRAGFSDVVDATIAVTPGSADSHAVMIVNMDRFSRVNACAGSLAGDELLISVARRIKGALRGCDTLARIGGDEFGVLVMVEEGPDDALHVAHRIHAALSAPFRLSDFEIRVDCSIGIALGGEAVVEPEDLIRHAQIRGQAGQADRQGGGLQPLHLRRRTYPVRH